MLDWKYQGIARIAAIGECMIERRSDMGPATAPVFSGDTLNTLTYMARLLARDRAELFYLTALGEDADSAAMLAAWEAEGINTACVRRFRDKLPGSYTIVTGAGGERCFSYARSRSAARDLFRDDYAETLPGRLRGFKLLYVSGISMAILAPDSREKLLNLLQTLRRAGVIIVYDPNYRAVLWTSVEEAREWTARIYRVTDVALPGFEDETALFNDATPAQACARLLGLGITEVIMKNGSLPCTVAVATDVASFPVTVQRQVVDTTAAGDSFNAGYIVARLCDYDLASSVRAGQSLAARVIQHPGAIMPRARTPSLSQITE